MLVVASAGEIFGEYSESYPLLVSAMTGASARVVGSCNHYAGYLVGTLAPDTKMQYFTLSGIATRSGAMSGGAQKPQYAIGNGLSAVAATEGTTVSPFDSYLAVETSLGLSSSVPVVLLDESPDDPTALDLQSLNSATTFPCAVYTLSGAKVMQATSAADLQRLTPGLYILRSATSSRKVSVR